MKASFRSFSVCKLAICIRLPEPAVFIPLSVPFMKPFLAARNRCLKSPSGIQFAAEATGIPGAGPYCECPAAAHKGPVRLSRRRAWGPCDPGHHALGPGHPTWSLRRSLLCCYCTDTPSLIAWISNPRERGVSCSLLTRQQDVLARPPSSRIRPPPSLIP